MILAPLKHTTIAPSAPGQILQRTLLVHKWWPQTICTISESEYHSLVSLILHRLVQTHVTYCTATTIILPYGSTILHLANSSFTLHTRLESFGGGGWHGGSQDSG